MEVLLERLATLDAEQVAWAAAGSLAIGAMLLAAAWLYGRLQHDQQRRRVDRAIAASDGAALQPVQEAPAGLLEHAGQAAVAVGERWSRARYGHLLLADEDKQLLDLCGYAQPAQARALFQFARGLLALVLPLAAMLLARGLLLPAHPLLEKCMVGFLGFALGWMLPKWVVARRVALRRRAADEELPLLIDLLRLLQSVGLSIDQSLHVVVHEFHHVMPVLAGELQWSVQQHTRGRSREQSLARLASGYENDDLAAICRLIVQVDRHGGAIQEPLNRFGERVREKRRLALREKVGRLTVKMTGVMVLTLLPALLIVTGGAGFLAVMRGMSRVAGGA